MVSEGQKIRIYLIRFGALINSAGGTEKVLCTMANYLSSHGYDVTIICCEKDKGLPFFHLDSDVELINLNGSGKVIKGKSYLRIKREILKIFKNLSNNDKDSIYLKERYDNIILKRFENIINNKIPQIIITFDYYSLLFLKYIAKSNIKTIAMLHNDVETYFNSKISNIGLDAFRKVDCIQILNEEKIPVIKQYIPQANVVYIPNAVVVTAIKKYDYCNYKIVNVGSLTKDIKRQHILIEAFNELKDDFPQWSLDIIGGIHSCKQKVYENELIEYIEKNELKSRVFLRGTCKNVVSQLISADIFAFHSKSEGFAIALVEAMSVGLPSIGFNYCPSVNRLIIDGQNGFLCNNKKDFIKKLKILMESANLRAKMGENAKKNVQKFSPDRVFLEWENLIKSIINKVQ